MKRQITNKNIETYSIKCATTAAVLIVLKLFGQITWPWFWVLTPIWITIIYVILFVIFSIFAIIWSVVHEYEHKGEQKD